MVVLLEITEIGRWTYRIVTGIISCALDITGKIFGATEEKKNPHPRYNSSIVGGRGCAAWHCVACYECAHLRSLMEKVLNYKKRRF
jgi:hypothetical protein